MITVDEAKKLVIENTEALLPLDFPVDCPLEDCLGRILAEDIVSSVDLPLFTNSSMDGFALKSQYIKSATSTNPVTLEIVGTIKAGDVPEFEVTNGSAARIMTGAPLPKGADSVVKVEDTESLGSCVNVLKRTVANENVRFSGEEIKKGERAILAGSNLTPAAIGFMAELGLGSVKVFSKPKVAIVVTGSELVDYHVEPPRGKIRETNSITLGSAMEDIASSVDLLGIAGDAIKDIEEKIKAGLEGYDILIVSGGVSVGDYDYVKSAIEDLGVERVFWRIAQKPGGPLYFGKKGKRLVFGLPGNPASSLMCFYEYIRPAILKMSGHKRCMPLELEAVLTHEIKKPTGKTHFLRGSAVVRNEGLHASVIGGQGSHMLKSFAEANCFIIVPSEAVLIEEGEMVKIHLLPGISALN